MFTITQLTVETSGRRILHNLSLSIGKGEFICLVGPNGAGKTTFLRALLALIPYSGRIVFNARDIQTISRKLLAQQVAYVPQNLDHVPSFSVREFVTMGRFAYRTPFSGLCAADRVAIEKALELTETSLLQTQSVSTLSGGERRRVLLAAALAQEPDTLVLDEPATSLDPAHEQSLYSILHHLHSELGKTVLVVSHDINRSATMGSRILAMKNGVFQFDGPPVDFMTAEVLGALYETSFTLVPRPDSSIRFALLPVMR